VNVDELLRQAVVMLQKFGVEQDPLSRVSPLPDLRTFRMYRAQGLIDEPNTKSGTAGVYGQRHLLQLVAIKALQARRHTLREIRTSLHLASDRDLEKLISGPQGGKSNAPVPTKRRSDFGPAKKDRRWVHFQLADGVLAMVADDVMSSARPSTIRAIGENLVASIMSCRT
jgi:DNA-binding transcriptional MerR regulator